MGKVERVRICYFSVSLCLRGLFYFPQGCTEESQMSHHKSTEVKKIFLLFFLRVSVPWWFILFPDDLINPHKTGIDAYV
jgi:hypothetical protein